MAATLLDEILERARGYERELPAFPGGLEVPVSELAHTIDHTLLKPEATPEQIGALCREAKEYGFASVCVQPVHAGRARRALGDSPVKTCVVIAFPHGATSTQAKLAEAREVLVEGAQELDMVLPIGLFRGGEYAYVLDEVRSLAELVHGQGALLKVILENVYLTRFEKILACLISQAAGADFVKTSTGFGPGGATVEDVHLMRCVVGPVERMGVKAAGGIHSLAEAQAMLRAGANRIGASAGVQIMREAQEAHAQA